MTDATTRFRRPFAAPAVAFSAVPILLAAVALSPARSSAQAAVGRVREAGTRRLLGGVTVALLDTAGRSAASTATDSLGVFYLDAPGPGRYALAFTWGGTHLTTAPHDFAAGEEVQAEYALAPAPAPPAPPPADTSGGGRAYFEFMVAKPVRVRPGNPAPHYPEAAKQMGVTAEVLAQFVVDTTGRAEPRTLKFLLSGGRDFDAAVRDVLPRMRFEPAQLRDGRKVPQIVQLPFSFSLVAPLAPPTRRPEPWDRPPGR